MCASINNVKVIGFDLDQTLYPKSSEIDEAIQGYIYKKIAQYKNCSLPEAESFFKDLYKNGKGLSGSKTLSALGIPGASEVVQEALERADIAEFLTPNDDTLKLLNSLKKRYRDIDLITGSTIQQVNIKLKKLGITEDIFNHIIDAEISKSDGSAFDVWVKFYPTYKRSEFLYIGDRASDYIVPKEKGIQSILVNIAQPDITLKCAQLKSLHDLAESLL